MNEYQQREYNQLLETLAKLNEAGAGVFQFKLEENKEEPARSTIRLNSYAPICVSYSDYTKKYSFFLSCHLLYVKWNTQKQIAEELTKPQEVGVLSLRKIREWTEYLTTIYTAMEEKSQERIQAVEEFKKEIEARGGTIKQNTYEYAPQDGAFSGEIVKNGIQFTYQVHDEGYISKKIEVYYRVNNSLEAFDMLADNKYTG